MGIISRLTDAAGQIVARLRPPHAPAPSQEKAAAAPGVPYGQSAGLYPGFAPYVDAFRKQRAPTPLELVQENLSTAYSCTILNADLVASTPLRLYVTTRRGQRKSWPSQRGDTRPVPRSDRARLEKQAPRSVGAGMELEEVTDHPLLALLDRPNDVSQDGSGVSRHALFDLTQRFLEVVGRAYWYVPTDALGVPTAIWILASHSVLEVVNPGSDRILDRYTFVGGSQKIDYEPDEVVPFRMPDLYNPYLGGMSPLRAVFEQVKLLRMHDARAAAVLLNSGRPDAVFSPRGSDTVVGISPEEATRLRDKFRHMFSLGGNGGVLVSEVAGTLTPLSWPTKDIIAPEQFDVTKTAIANGYGVPISKLNRTDANRASAETADYAHARDAGLPRLRRLEAAVNTFLVPKYDPERTGRLFVAYDSPVAEDREADREDDKVLVSMGGLTVNEQRGKYGLEPIAGGDVRLVPNNLTPVGSDGRPERQPTAAPAADPASAPSASDPDPEHQSEAVAGNDLRATVGGSQALLELQEAYYGGNIPREAAIANATLIFGFSPEEAEALFPEKEPEPAPAPTPPAQEPGQAPPPAQPDPEPAREPADKVAAAPVAKMGPGTVAPDGTAGPLPRGEDLAAALRGLFAAQRDQILAQLGGDLVTGEGAKAITKAGGDGDDDLPDALPLGDWLNRFVAAAKPLVETTYRAAAHATLTRLGVPADVFAVVDRNVPKAAQALALKFAESTNRTTQMALDDALASLRNEVAEGIAQGDTRAELARRVQTIFTEATEERAVTIAATETSRAVHAADLQSARESGVVRGKRWLASADACEECRALADLGVIDLDATYAQDDYGPVDAPPRHPHCACTQVMELKDTPSGDNANG